ncbi:MAG TPA: FecR domain-containing protein [Polyangiaceae bacterium]|nr:FecR domain-containing protein [Polyangiaceae bacterium]
MNTPRYAAAAAKLLKQGLPATTVVAGDEARGIATIQRAMFARTRRRRWVMLGGSLAAAAAVSIVGAQLVQWRSRSVVAAAPVAIDVTPSGKGAALARTEGEQQLTARAPIESGQRIDTPADGGAALQFSTGTSLTLAGRTSFRVESQGSTQRFSLQHGELVAHVAKLTNAQRFIVDTPDAEVEVRGTRFRLRVVEQPEACGAGTRTRLEVTEGAVEVRIASQNAISVKAGDVWPTDCSGAADTTQASDAAPPATHAGAASQKHEVRPPASASAPAPTTEAERASALTAQNDLFAEGVAKGRQGDPSGALRAYQDLMSRFPGSPLAENAMVERMRLLAATPDGAAEARRYLKRYPHGFAVGEAKKLLAEP